MNIYELHNAIFEALEKLKAKDIKIFNTCHLNTLFDTVFIASGTSNRQTKALARNIIRSVKANGGILSNIEGIDVGEWILVDFGDAIVHIMQPLIRKYFNLEELWGDKPLQIEIFSKSLLEKSRELNDSNITNSL